MKDYFCTNCTNGWLKWRMPHWWSLLALLSSYPLFNTLRPRQNGRHFPDDIFKWIFLNESVWISINISPKFVPRGPINNSPTLVQVMAWRRPGDKLLSEPMMVRLPTHICVTWPQWVKSSHCNSFEDCAPVDEIYRSTVFRWGAGTKLCTCQDTG